MYIFLFNSSQNLEPQMPLVFLGEMIKRNGWRNPIKLIFMKGYDEISTSYINSLRDCNYEIHDVSFSDNYLKEKYYNLAQLSDYKFYTYIRWIVFKELVDKGQISLPLNSSGYFALARSRHVGIISITCPIVEQKEPSAVLSPLGQ